MNGWCIVTGDAGRFFALSLKRVRYRKENYEGQNNDR
jgi:hypothetical protein